MSSEQPAGVSAPLAAPPRPDSTVTKPATPVAAGHLARESHSFITDDLPMGDVEALYSFSASAEFMLSKVLVTASLTSSHESDRVHHHDGAVIPFSPLRNAPLFGEATSADNGMPDNHDTSDNDIRFETQQPERHFLDMHLCLAAPVSSECTTTPTVTTKQAIVDAKTSPFMGSKVPTAANQNPLLVSPNEIATQDQPQVGDSYKTTGVLTMILLQHVFLTPIACCFWRKLPHPAYG